MYSFVYDREIKHYEYYYIQDKNGKKIKNQQTTFCFCIDRSRKIATFLNAQNIEDIINVNELLDSLLDLCKMLDIQGYSVDDKVFPYYINKQLVNLLGVNQI